MAAKPALDSECTVAEAVASVELIEKGPIPGPRCRRFVDLDYAFIHTLSLARRTPGMHSQAQRWAEVGAGA
ncbi:hypothetical protein ACWIGW_31295 [Nocardia brasiliensis]